MSGNDFNLGDYGAAGTTGTMTVQDNAMMKLTGGGIYIGKSGAAIGNVTMTGGTFDARVANVFQLGQAAGAQGTWTQSGGTTYAGGWVSIGRGGDLSSTGALTVSGGLFDGTSTGNGFMIGEQGTGTLTISGTGRVVSEANNVGFAVGWNQGTGTVNLDGGFLVANFVQGGSGSSTFNLNGGSLVASTNAVLNFMTNLSIVTVMSSSTIDSSSRTIAINQVLLDGGFGGGLTKIGSGTLLLNGANTYSGATTVAAGSLGGIGTIAGPVVVQTGATLSPGALGIGTLTVNNALTLNAGSTTMMELNNTNGCDLVTGVSAVTYGGTLVLKNVGAPLKANDSFKLFTAGSYTGSFTVQAVTPGQTVTWDLSSLSVDGTVKVASAVADVVPITASVSADGSLSITWPVGGTGWILQQQVNTLAVGITNNWVNVAGSSSTNAMKLPIDTTSGAVFYRLTH